MGSGRGWYVDRKNHTDFGQTTFCTLSMNMFTVDTFIESLAILHTKLISQDDSIIYLVHMKLVKVIYPYCLFEADYQQSFSSISKSLLCRCFCYSTRVCCAVHSRGNAANTSFSDVASFQRKWVWRFSVAWNNYFAGLCHHPVEVCIFLQFFFTILLRELYR